MLKISDIESVVLLSLTIECRDFEYPPLGYREYLTLERDLRIFGFSGINDLMRYESTEIIGRLSVAEELVVKAKNRLLEIGVLLKYLDGLAINGIYVITKFDKGFPSFLKQKSKDKSSFYLYYSGSLDNLSKGVRLSGLANMEFEEKELIERLIMKIKKENKYYVSIGEKGIDMAGLELALKHNVNIVLIAYRDYFRLLDGYREYVKNKKMIVVSQFEPDSKYDPTNEIVSDGLSSRFCDFRIILSCKPNSGLTWFNAIQNLTYKWTRIFVVNNRSLGNQKLLAYDYVKLNPADCESEFSFEYLYEKNRRLCIVDIEEFTQMSIFDFIPGGNEDEQIVTV